METRYDLMVIGAGIGGLILAHQCAQAGLRVGVFEAQAAPGGCLRTARFSVAGREFWVELGAHTLFNSYRSLLALFPALDLDDAVQARVHLPFRLWSGGDSRSLVAALHWGELARSLPRALLQRRRGQRIGDYFAAVAGPRNYAQVIGPALNGLLCQSADEFPAELVFKTRERQPGYPRSFSLRGGMSTLVERLADKLDLHLARPIERLVHEGGGFRCATQGRWVRAASVGLAVPPQEAARLLAEVAPEVARRLDAIAMVEVESTAVVVRARALRLQPLAGLVARDAPFLSMVSRDVIPDRDLRGFTFHARAPSSEAARLGAAAEVLGTREFAAAVHATHRLPALRLGHEARMEAIDRQLRGAPIALVGNYFGGLSIEDCAARARAEAVRLVTQMGGAAARL